MTVQKITYANTEHLTGDDIAVAVLEYSRALGEAGLAETIEIPVLDAEGHPSSATMLVGPASQIVTENTESDFPELIDTDVVAALTAKTQRLRPVVVADPEPIKHTEWAGEL